MQAFNELRKQAREKRDRLIETARKAYAETLTRIAELEQDILGRELSTHKTIASCINRVLPSDRAFTTLDVMTGLEALDPSRAWRKRSVDNHLSQLRERGIVKRLRKASGQHVPALYVRKGVDATVPFEDMRFPDVIATVLQGKSMTTVEIALAMLEAGYQTSRDPRSLRDAVGVTMRGDKRRRFRRGASGKWAVVSG